MTKTTCDRCGLEADSVYRRKVIDQMSGPGDIYNDLCRGCWDGLRRLITAFVSQRVTPIPTKKRWGLL